MSALRCPVVSEMLSAEVEGGSRPAQGGSTVQDIYLGHCVYRSRLALLPISNLLCQSIKLTHLVHFNIVSETWLAVPFSPPSDRNVIAILLGSCLAYLISQAEESVGSLASVGAAGLTRGLRPRKAACERGSVDVSINPVLLFLAPCIHLYHREPSCDGFFGVSRWQTVR